MPVPINYRDLVTVLVTVPVNLSLVPVPVLVKNPFLLLVPAPLGTRLLVQA